MMKSILKIAIALLSTPLLAQTNLLERGQVYRGEELLNENRTGNICYVTIQAVNISGRGLHCYGARWQYASLRNELPKGELSSTSRITNYHRSEFPELKTCAQTLDNLTNTDEIYSPDTTNLYNQVFGGSHKEGRIRFDYFLTVGSESKELVRARIHVQKIFNEYDVDCVNLELM